MPCTNNYVTGIITDRQDKTIRTSFMDKLARDGQTSFHVNSKDSYDA